jgi:hypothetical protein
MKVFLSSTAQDLLAYRQIADDTILRPFSGGRGDGAVRAAAWRTGVGV